MVERLIRAFLAVVLLALAGAILAQPVSAGPAAHRNPRPSNGGQAAPSVAGVVDIVAGDEHMCALFGNGMVKCWGANGLGQLGDGTITYRTTPVDVIRLGTVTSITAGSSHTCVLVTDGSVKCWGYNGSGQLGDGTTTARNQPLRVANLGGPAAAVSAGGNHTCALLASGVVRCWGANYSSQLGTGSNSPGVYLTPVTANVGSGTVMQVAVGGSHTCVLLDTGGVRCWGSNGNGELGLGFISDPNPQPQTPTGLSSGVVRIVVRNGSACALLGAGGLLCWGPNDYGQVGTGNVSPRESAPRQVISLTLSVIDFVASGWRSCAITAERLLCWGSVGADKLGNGQTDPPVLVPAPVWGLLSGVTKVVASSATCVLIDGGVMCWGENYAGQLGDGSTIYRSRPVAVIGLEPVAFAGQCASEGFDNVLPVGWSVKNNSTPLGATNWFIGNTGYFTAQAGALTSYAAANVDSTGFFGTISDWLISPVISVTNDARVAVWTRKVVPDLYPDRLQVRLSQAGDSMDVGATAESVGDFTTLLYDVNPGLVTNTYPIDWYPLTLTLRGITGTVSGRVAFRYFVTDGGPGGLNSDYVGVDSFTHCVAASALPATGTPTPTATSTATPTPTPTSTATPTPTSTATTVPAPSYFAFVPKVLK